MELKGLLEQHLILHRPLIRKGSEVGQVLDGPVQVVLVPEQHAQGLLRVVAVLELGHFNIFINCINKKREEKIRKNSKTKSKNKWEVIYKKDKVYYI